jgi:hypothetical protein
MKSMFDCLKPYFNTHLYLVAGYFIGAIATSVHFVPWTQEDITFADIGGMMAGFGTIGLFSIAWRATSDWRRQALRANMEKWFILNLRYHRVYQDEFIQILFEYEQYTIDGIKPPFNSSDKEEIKLLKKSLLQCWKDLIKIKTEIELVELLIGSYNNSPNDFKDESKELKYLPQGIKYYQLFKKSKSDLKNINTKAKEKEKLLVEYSKIMFNNIIN